MAANDVRKASSTKAAAKRSEGKADKQEKKAEQKAEEKVKDTEQKADSAAVAKASKKSSSNAAATQIVCQSARCTKAKQKLDAANGHLNKMVAAKVKADAELSAMRKGVMLADEGKRKAESVANNAKTKA